jgi:hypothetical protein
MSPYRKHLPQLAGRLFLADAGLETMLSFQQGFTLPAFASFVLLQHERGPWRERLHGRPPRANPTVMLPAPGCRPSPAANKC